MLDKEEAKTSEEEVAENIESLKEEKENTLEKTRKEQKIKETTLKETEKKEKIEENKEEKVEDEKQHNKDSLTKDKISFLTYFKEGIKNTLGTFIVSIGALAIVALVLRYILGFYLVDTWGILFIVYLVVSLFYPYIKAKLCRKNK